MLSSIFELYTVGPGPSSSHTVGPMRAARFFVEGLRTRGVLGEVAGVRAELFGSLAATGVGHGTPTAVLAGFAGVRPELVTGAEVAALATEVAASGRLPLAGERPVPFNLEQHVLMRPHEALPRHANAMRFTALGAEGQVLSSRELYSVGGGTLYDERGQHIGALACLAEPPLPFTSGVELLAQCEASGLSISGVMLRNEASWRSEQEVRQGLLRIWRVMQEAIEHGCRASGVLPGGLELPRRAAAYLRSLGRSRAHGQYTQIERVTLYALAVAEENAAGGRVVTAPTNGAAGIVPAVLQYIQRSWPVPGDSGVVEFLLAAGAIGLLFRRNASISGAEVGCQGEVGVACSMAAGGLAEVLGGTPQQVEAAAEIAMEHNLGLTCDPVCGLVQVPCIERNAVAAVTAITAATLALRGDGTHLVPFDTVVETMYRTGRDMLSSYRETSRAGLAATVAPLSVGHPEC